VIVVVGQPAYRAVDDRPSVDGLPARIARSAAQHGRSVQLVGKAGEDPEGDAVVLALAAAGVGHVALLRDAGGSTLRATEPTSFEQDLRETKLDETPVIDDTQPTAGMAALDAADVELALRYLTDFAVVVLADPADPAVVATVADAARWVGARFILVVAQGQAIPDRLPSDAIVFEAPVADPDGAFASLVGVFAAALDDGEDPGEAFRSSIDTNGWAPSSAD
jgi:hypothetical protein